MDILKTFDPYAMIAPKGPEQILALLDEFTAELQILQGHFDAVAEQCEAELARA